MWQSEALSSSVGDEDDSLYLRDDESAWTKLVETLNSLAFRPAYEYIRSQYLQSYQTAKLELLQYTEFFIHSDKVEICICGVAIRSPCLLCDIVRDSSCFCYHKLCKRCYLKLLTQLRRRSGADEYDNPVPRPSSSRPTAATIGGYITPGLQPSGNWSSGDFECGAAGGSVFNHPSVGPPPKQNEQKLQKGPPMEFTHAITYVNKIKNRFLSQPEKYKQFLEILHAYQKDQRNARNAGGVCSYEREQEVYNQVAKLFEHHEDLLVEFGKFLPKHTPPTLESPPSPVASAPPEAPAQVYVMTNGGAVQHHQDVWEPVKEPQKLSTMNHYQFKPYASTSQPQQIRKPRSSVPYKKHIRKPSFPAARKLKFKSSFKVAPLPPPGKYGTLRDFTFFDKVRHFLRRPETYDNFLRILMLFDEDVLSRSEVLDLVTPFLLKTPELLTWIKQFLEFGFNKQAPSSSQKYNPVRGASKHVDSSEKEDELPILNLSSCKRLEGSFSYCELPARYTLLKCSGRTELCRQVLNDKFVSFPTWSQDSTCMATRKDQFEEALKKREDERFELDYLIETTNTAIVSLEAAKKMMSRMSEDELKEFELDDYLGGTSLINQKLVLQRLYREKTDEIIESLKRSPSVIIPVVLKRLKAKAEDLREAQKGLNRIWKEKVDKLLQKALANQGNAFREVDIRALRSTSLITGIETAVDKLNTKRPEPHSRLSYRDRSGFNDDQVIGRLRSQRKATIENKQNKKGKK